MAAQGYDLNRFIDQVREEYICFICFGVLNDPRHCQNQEHPFCLACITHYLQNSATQECPACREHLTPETLKHPGRFFMVCLSELTIKCDYIDQGCRDHIQLGNLQHHVGNCGFAPVKCEKCDMQINRKDKDNHDKSFCQLGGAKCQDCGNIKANQDEMKAELCQVKARQGELKRNQDDMKESQDVMKQQLNKMKATSEEYQRKHDQMERSIEEIKQQLNTFMEYQRSINRQLNKRKHNQMEVIMAFEGNDRVPRPPELNIVLPKLHDIGKEVHEWSSDEIRSQRPTNILLITANDDEFIACYKYMSSVKRSFCNSIGMVDFGQFGEQKRVALMKCAQGPMKSAITVKNAAEILNPQVVLFVGICESMKPKKAKLGDVVISSKLATYEDRKVREDGTVEYGGVKANVSRNMALLILNAADGWQPPLKDSDNSKFEVHRDAVMLSGSDLVNSRLRRDELGEYFRDALGVEMEGAGLYAAAHDLGTEWAVIKAVSDSVGRNEQMTNDWHRFASVMAASVVHNMFKHSVVLKDWLHYNVNEVKVQPQQPATPSNQVEI